MSNEDKILELLQQMDKRLERIETKVESLEEGQEEIREGVNTLIEWAEKVSEAREFPVPQILGA